jgi:hypothetical protein
VRPLPRSLDPLADESLPGFLLRLSHRLEQPPAEIAAATGLTHDRIIPASLLLALPPGAAGQFAEAARLSGAEASSLTLGSLGRRYPPLDLAADGRMRQAQGATGLTRWVFTRSARYCPECLSGSGTPVETRHGGSWRKTWRLPVTMACLQHQRLLEHLCPGCGGPVHHTTGEGLILQPGAVLHPAQCRASQPGAACGVRLDQARHVPARQPASHLILDLQRHLAGMFGPGEETARQHAGRHLQDLRMLSGLITMTWPLALPLMPGEPALSGAFNRHAANQQREIEERRRQGLRTQALARHDTPPLDAAACAGLLLTASALLRPRPARGDIGTLVAAAFPSTEWHTFFDRVAEFCSPGLRETIEAAMSRVRPPSRRGENSRLLKKPPRPPRPRPQPAVDAWTAYHLRKGHLVIRPQGDCQFDYRHVPQHLPGAWIDARFSDVPARHFRYLNTVAAIRLVQMSSGGSHATAGEQLGIPSGTVSHAVHHVRVWTRDPANSERFTAAVREFADHLNHSASLVDYARRRAQLAEWIIPPDDWKQVSAQIAATPGLKQAGRASQRRRALFSVLAWAAATSGEPVLAPLVRAAPGGASQLRQDIAQARYHARARPTQFPAALARAAESYGANLAAAIDSATAAPSGRP